MNRLRQAAQAERGAATAEFTMVAALLVLLFLAVIQFAGMIHIRNTLIDAASTGARFGALNDRTGEDGAARTQALISSSIASRYAQDITYEYLEVPEGRTLRITVRAQVPVLVVGPGVSELEVTGTAHEYG
ncbi:TadE/TadG family type IV pilus assembly protein [Nesterenkonia alkaliphila]|uniref:Pilus assembly protein n=1 Tax=Nesterenkonia alkaliphila TaxID=1463631 RepID=A0A7K1UIF7_9MICC|nr:TadE/TadG family type IV pilus assembly protein [Nesterenkonia alkaliphila]MVT26174.1 pilus assembly protein [Nesterenkonia alkaliphila]